MNLATLRDQRKQLARELRAHLDRTPGKLWTARDQAAFDAKLEEVDRLDTSIRAAQRKLEQDEAQRHGLSEAEFGSVFDTWARNGQRGLSPAQREFVNTMSTTTGSQGGFTVQTDVAERFADLLKDYSGVRRVAEVIVTPKGNPLSWPTSDGTAETAELVAENATATAADPVFGSAALNTFKYSSKIFTVPLELLQDSAIDLEGFILARAAARIGRLSNGHFTTGTGGGQPQGFAPVATAGKVGTTGQTLTVIHDDLVDLVHSVNTGYRQDPSGGVCFQMSDAAFKVCRKLKDASQRPLYLPDDGEDGESILGYPVIVNDDVAVPAANAKSIFFGNFRQCYKVRDALEVSLFRFDDSGFIKLGQVGFLAFARCGGNLVDTNGVRYYQHSAT